MFPASGVAETSPLRTAAAAAGALVASVAYTAVFNPFENPSKPYKRCYFLVPFILFLLSATFADK